MMCPQAQAPHAEGVCPRLRFHRLARFRAAACAWRGGAHAAQRAKPRRSHQSPCRRAWSSQRQALACGAAMPPCYALTARCPGIRPRSSTRGPPLPAIAPFGTRHRITLGEIRFSCIFQRRLTPFLQTGPVFHLQSDDTRSVTERDSTFRRAHYPRVGTRRVKESRHGVSRHRPVVVVRLCVLVHDGRGYPGRPTDGSRPRSRQGRPERPHPWRRRPRIALPSRLRRDAGSFLPTRRPSPPVQQSGCTGGSDGPCANGCGKPIPLLRIVVHSNALTVARLPLAIVDVAGG